MFLRAQCYTCKKTFDSSVMKNQIVTDFLTLV